MGGKDVTVIEIAPRCLSLAYDDGFCDEMEAIIASRGIKIKTSTQVQSIEGTGRVESVRLSDGSEIEADVVILGIGATANVDLARNAGLEIGTTGGIVVDRTMKTSDPFILACGDCAEKVSFFGGHPTSLKLASIATLEARVAGANLYHVTRETAGTVGAWSTAVGDFALGTAGLTESMARDYGYETVAAYVETVNRHPGGMPEASKTKLKLVFEADTGIMLGGQVRGDLAAGEIVNILSACVQKRMTAEDIATFQIGTHPALTASPIAYPLVNAAEIAIGKMRSQP
jgi:NADPH-dependent 2,4-dienoyl-CoA reductase/sulfur reductase-like enzyme